MTALNTVDLVNDQKFWLIFEQAAVGIALVLPDGLMLRTNPEFCKLLGYPKDYLKGRDFREVTHPYDHQADAALIEKALSGEVVTYRIEKRFMRADGRVVWGLLSSSLVCDEEGNPDYFIAVVQDITERKSAQDELARARDLYLAVSDNVSDLVSVHAPNGDYLYAGAACRSLLGYEPEELVGTNVFSHFHPADLRSIGEAHEQAGGGVEGEAAESQGLLLYRLRRKDGEYIWVETYSRYVHAMRNEGRQILCISRFVEEPSEARARATGEKWGLAQSNTILDALALRDDLTGLMNGAAIVEMLAGRIASRRSSTFPFGCLLVGVDNFTAVNDNYGYAIGDDTLRRISRLLVECCRTEDHVARLRGDEFVVVLPGTDSAGTIVVAERLIYTIRNAYWPELAPDYKLTISVGGTCVTRSTDMNVDEFLDLLTSQMRQAQELGRNRLVMDARNIARHWLR